MSDRLLVGLFALLLLCPPLLHVAGLDQSSAELEQRVLSAAPGLPKSPSGWRDFGSQLEGYLADHIGLRPALISLALGLKFSLHLPATQSVLIGKDGWVFNTAEQELDQHTGIRLMTQDELLRWVAILEEYRSWLASRGIGFVFVVVPDKETIYPEHLPDGVSLYPTSPATQLMAELARRPTIDAVDLHAVLLAAKDRELLYFKTDTHWNAVGAYTALKAVANGRWPGGLRLPPLSDYRQVPGKMHGDLGREVGFGCCEPEADTNLVPRAGSSVAAQGGSMDRASAAGWIDSVHKDYPSVFVFGDSFATFWADMIPDITRRFVYRRNDVAFPVDEILAEKPDLVIYEIAEKFLTQRIARPLAGTP